MHKQLVIGVTGLKGAGKTEVSKAIESVMPKDRTQFINFADAMKEIACSVLGLSLDQLEALKRAEEEGVIISGCVASVTTMRKFLQKLGESVKGVTGDRNIWINIATNKIMFNSNVEVAIVGDVRFPFEAEALKKEFGSENVYIIKVDRGMENSDFHESEMYINDIQEDIKILNNGTLEDLKIEAEYVGKMIYEGWKISSEENND